MNDNGWDVIEEKDHCFFCVNFRKQVFRNRFRTKSSFDVVRGRIVLDG